jgi:hypothetical protein
MSVAVLRNGIFARGVPLDVWAARLTDYPAADDNVTVRTCRPLSPS